MTYAARLAVIRAASSRRHPHDPTPPLPRSAARRLSLDTMIVAGLPHAHRHRQCGRSLRSAAGPSTVSSTTTRPVMSSRGLPGLRFTMPPTG